MDCVANKFLFGGHKKAKVFHARLPFNNPDLDPPCSESIDVIRIWQGGSQCRREALGLLGHSSHFFRLIGTCLRTRWYFGRMSQGHCANQTRTRSLVGTIHYLQYQSILGDKFGRAGRTIQSRVFSGYPSSCPGPHQRPGTHFSATLFSTLCQNQFVGSDPKSMTKRNVGE